MKAQASAFIVVGILLIAVLGLIFMLREEPVVTEAPADLNPIESFSHQCLESASEESLQQVALKGGYFYVEEPLEDSDVHVYYKQGVKDVPSIEEVELQLSVGSTLLYSACIQDFETFKDRGIDVNLTSAVVVAEINQGDVTFDLMLDAIARLEDTAAALRGTETAIESRLKETHEMSNRLTDEVEPGWFPLSKLVDFADEYDISFEVVKYRSGSVVALKAPQMYAFAYADDAMAASEDTGYNETAYAGYEFNYVLPDGDYHAYTSLFEIDGSTISFIPEEEDVGQHEVLVKDLGSGEIFIFKLNIISLNSKPVMDISDQVIDLTQSTVWTYDVNATDADGDSIFYNLDASLPDMSINTITGMIYYDFVGIVQGPYTLTVVATDINGGTAIESFHVVVQDE